MNFETIARYALDFFHRYPYLIVAMALVLLLIIWKKPKESFKFTLFLLIMAAVFYAIGLFRDTVTTGVKGTNQGIEKSRNLE